MVSLRSKNYDTPHGRVPTMKHNTYSKKGQPSRKPKRARTLAELQTTNDTTKNQ